MTSAEHQGSCILLYMGLPCNLLFSMSSSTREEKPSPVSGVDHLWKWQLRKEHSALLAEMEKHKSVILKDTERTEILARLRDQEESFAILAEKYTRKFKEAEDRIVQIEQAISRLEQQELARSKAFRDPTPVVSELISTAGAEPKDSLQGNHYFLINCISR